MSFAETPEGLTRSIKVVNIPSNCNKDDIIENLRKVGTILNIKTGDSTMIFTYSTTSEKEVSKMYDGCPIGNNYILKIQDADSWEVDNGVQTQESIHKVEEQKIQTTSDTFSTNTSTYQRNSYEPSYSTESNTKQEDRSSLPARISNDNTDDLLKKYSQTGNDLSTSGRMSTSSTADSGELLKILQRTNVPAKLSLPKEDAFNSVYQTKYFVFFTVVWASWLFISAVF